MRKIIILLLCATVSIAARSQLVVNLQSPPAGFTYKPQLWTMLLTNTTSSVIRLHIEVTLTAYGTSQQVMTGVTNVFSLAPGTTQLNATMLSPIQYNLVSGSYTMDANPYGLLPMGHFDACFNFFTHASDNVQQVSEQCEEIVVEPLSPPQLIFPYDQTAIEDSMPQFTWLPPVPANLFTNLRYDLDVVEMTGNQSAADAIEQNIPLYQRTDLAPTTLLYPLSAPALEYGKNYAWRIVAKSNGNAVGSSETWQFSLKHFASVTTIGEGGLPYVKLKKAPECGYAIFSGDLKFDYLNETADSVWNVRVSDLSTTGRDNINLQMDTLKLLPGQNLVNYPTTGSSFFVDHHFYLLEIFNSRNEIWRLRFEMRRPSEENNF
jgi:hypothetical protein